MHAPGHRMTRVIMKFYAEALQAFTCVELAIIAIDPVVVPTQYMDRQARPSPRQFAEQLTELQRSFVGRRRWQYRARVEIPASNQNMPARTQQRSAERGEIGFTVDQQGRSLGERHSPACFARA